MPFLVLPTIVSCLCFFSDLLQCVSWLQQEQKQQRTAINGHWKWGCRISELILIETWQIEQRSRWLWPRIQPGFRSLDHTLPSKWLCPLGPPQHHMIDSPAQTHVVPLEKVAEQCGYYVQFHSSQWNKLQMYCPQSNCRCFVLRNNCRYIHLSASAVDSATMEMMPLWQQQHTAVVWYQANKHLELKTLISHYSTRISICRKCCHKDAQRASTANKDGLKLTAKTGHKQKLKTNHKFFFTSIWGLRKKNCKAPTNCMRVVKGSLRFT